MRLSAPIGMKLEKLLKVVLITLGCEYGIPTSLNIEWKSSYTKLLTSDYSYELVTPAMTTLPFENSFKVYILPEAGPFIYRLTAVFITLLSELLILLKNGGDWVKSMLNYLDLISIKDLGSP